MENTRPKIFVIIPANNEENAIGKVIQELPKAHITEIIVIDNCSTDNTGQVAKEEGATVLKEPLPGYGRTCLCGLKYLQDKKNMQKNDIVAFIDGDYSDYPAYLTQLINPIIKEGKKMVIGSRTLGNREKGAMTIPQIFGNWLSTSLLKLLYKAKFTDLGPFRTITWETLEIIKMQDKTFGWTVEMQLKVAKLGYAYCEIPVPYRRRIGFSKISGTIKGAFSAGYKILWTIFKYL